MEVTRKNFHKAYNILEREVENADFIAIDTEFTGLSTIKRSGIKHNTLEELYDELKVGTSEMLLIQFGICLFIWKEKFYEAVPFTFFIFPQSYKGFGNDVMYSSQSSSINYLALHGFDFNKLFHEGISFMSLLEERSARERFQKDLDKYAQQRQHKWNEGDEQLLASLKRIQNEWKQNEERILDEVVGFSNIIKLIVKSKKPIIGHNMLLDLFLTSTNFFGPPPSNLKDFESFLTGTFPVMFDTKVIAETPQFKKFLYSTSIHSLFNQIKNNNLPYSNVVISEKSEGEAEYKSEFHQAGYDSYCTGLIFISLMTYLSMSEFSNRIDWTCNFLREYINCIYVMNVNNVFFTKLLHNNSTGDRKESCLVNFISSWRYFISFFLLLFVFIEVKNLNRDIYCVSMFFSG